LTVFEKLAEEFLDCFLTPPPLDENIQHLAPLIHRTPQTVILLLDRDEHLIQVSLITGTWTPASQLIGLLLAELPTPLADRFVRHDDPPRTQELCHVAMAQAEAQVEPDLVVDNLPGSGTGGSQVVNAACLDEATRNID
jgi:hypothetical protein